MKRAAVLVVLLLVGGVSTGALTYARDHDGISTFEELSSSTDPFDSDTDADGLDDDRELELASDPTVADTDGDGVRDGPEVAAGTDPVVADTDGDGLDDNRELSLDTNPVVADTDSDGLGDGDEAAVHGTDPVDRDTDDDGLHDRAEVAVHGTNPTQADTDSDGLDDAVEANEASTSPTESDTDGDGLSDGTEAHELTTDPTSVDTDGDGLDDGAEVNEYGSDPTSVDTDGDGLNDGREASLGTDPTDSDTDGDGFRDGVEVRDESVLTNADPLRKDVFLEIDYMRGTTVPEEKLESVEKAFANAPVRNPDGSRGITLHVRTGASPVAPEAKTSLVQYSASYYRSEFDTRGYGYYHALIVREVPDGDARGNRVGITSIGVDGLLVEDRPNPVRVAKTLMHELGHNLGLYPGDHRGIDSYALKPKQYPSVMNYHRLGPCDCNYDYSDGSHGPNDFDDWGHIAAELAEQAPNTGKVEAIVLATEFSGTFGPFDTADAASRGS